MNSEDRTPTSGLSICFILTIMLTVLKLTGTISWSWWIVLAPMLIPCLLYMIIVVFALIVIIIASIISVIKD